MIISFENRIAKKKADLVVDVINFGQQVLFPDHDHIEFNIEMIAQDELHGDCLYEEYEDEIEVVIRLSNRLSNQDLIVTLLHELVHVSQHTKGMVMDTTSNYDDRWQEIEAHGMEGELYEKYIANNS